LAFGADVLRVTQSAAFRWTMTVFVLLCLLGSGFSIWHWISHTRGGKK
jgi:hypothetical protein